MGWGSNGSAMCGESTFRVGDKGITGPETGAKDEKIIHKAGNSGTSRYIAKKISSDSREGCKGPTEAASPTLS